MDECGDADYKHFFKSGKSLVEYKEEIGVKKDQQMNGKEMRRRMKIWKCIVFEAL